MRLIIVRHGESEWDRIGRYQGQGDARSPTWGCARPRRWPCGSPMSRSTPSSPARSARAKTAEAIARYHRETPFEHRPALLEIHHGDWQGLLADEVIERYGEGLREWREHPTRAQMPNGEQLATSSSACSTSRSTSAPPTAGAMC